MSDFFTKYYPTEKLVDIISKNSPDIYLVTWSSHFSEGVDIIAVILEKKGGRNNRIQGR